MTVTIRLPDGEEIDIAGTDDPKVAAAAARKVWERRQASAPAQQAPARPSIAERLPKPPPRKLSGWQTAKAFGGDIIDNITPNWGDEIAGAADAVGAAVRGNDPRAAFAQGQKDFLRTQAQYDREHPGLAWTSTIAGTGASLVVPGGAALRGLKAAPKAAAALRRLPKVPPFVRRMAAGAGTGAAYGAVAGLGDQSGEGRLANAQTYGAIGAAGGAIMDPALRLGAATGRVLRNNVPGVDSAVQGLARVPKAVLAKMGYGQASAAAAQSRGAVAADRVLQRRMNEGHISTGTGQPGAQATPQAIADEVERRAAMGVPAMAGDTTDAMRTLTGAASRGMGPGQTLVREALDRRKLEEASRIRQHVSDEFGAPVDVIRQQEDVVRAAKDRAAPAYQEAYAQPMMVTPEIEAIMRTPAFTEALGPAVRNIRNDMRDPTGLGFRMDAEGNVTGLHGLTTEGFDQVVRAMRDNGRAAATIDPLTGRVINNTNSVHINARAGELRDQIGLHNEPYREAVENYGDAMTTRDALRTGYDFDGLNAQEIAAQARTIPREAQRDWTTGATARMADAASEYGAKYPTGNTARHVRQMLGDEAKQAEIGQLSGNTGGVRGLQERLEAEHQGNILWGEVAGNSKTSMRRAADEDLAAAAGSVPVQGFSAVGLVRTLADFTASKVRPQFEEDLKARIAEVVTETNPATLRELMDQIAARAARDADFGQALERGGLRLSHLYGRSQGGDVEE